MTRIGVAAICSVLMTAGSSVGQDPPARVLTSNDIKAEIDTDVDARSVVAQVLTHVVSPTAPLAAQQKPDFSGSWTLESGASGMDIPQALSVSQSLVRTNVRGEPMQPFFKDITVTRVLASSTRSETYHIGGVGGGVSVGSTGGQRTHYRVAWEEQALVIESGSYTGPIPESGNWAERREVWSLDSGVRLNLAITVRSSVDAPKTVTLVYRRE